ncbi:hypothetical protein KAI19_00810 [bacterium]|nr:hypothetical protein [bacterium]
MKNIHLVGNYIEAILWALIAITVLIRSRKSPKQLKQIAVQTSIAFFSFAVSDLIEVQTGAWWRPWWLLLLKIICVIALCLNFIRYRTYLKK